MVPAFHIAVKGQEVAKRAFEVTCAGGHNVLLKGSPGMGKTLLARCPRSARAPFRTPHHTISHVAFVGGGSWPRPGEISLAHKGVLFLDEFVEMGEKNIEALRQPLEDRVITISRESPMR